VGRKRLWYTLKLHSEFLFYKIYQRWGLFSKKNVSADEILGINLKEANVLYMQSPFQVFIVQDDQKFSVHLMSTVQKHAKIFSTVSVTYHDNVVRIRDNRWRERESSVPLVMAVGCQAVRLSQVAWRLAGDTLYITLTFCIVIIRCTQTFDHPIQHCMNSHTTYQQVKSERRIQYPWEEAVLVYFKVLFSVVHLKHCINCLSYLAQSDTRLKNQETYGSCPPILKYISEYILLCREISIKDDVTV
jgi:hypothetical protein